MTNNRKNPLAIALVAIAILPIFSAGTPGTALAGLSGKMGEKPASGTSRDSGQKLSEEAEHDEELYSLGDEIYIIGGGNIYWGKFYGSGIGKYIYANGDIYMGEVMDGLRNGEGVYSSFSTGNIYEGQFKDGKMDGIGKLTYGNGDVFYGEFRDNEKKNGKSIVRLGKVREVELEFVDGVVVSQTLREIDYSRLLGRDATVAVRGE
ncbi:MAG: hypothetical protein LBU15_00870 [Rickettsiales bacterium]|jgi:hypothetical protein|nr:hypothetical protein [Rickettsiales bacterium]